MGAHRQLDVHEAAAEIMDFTWHKAVFSFKMKRRAGSHTYTGYTEDNTRRIRARKIAREQKPEDGKGAKPFFIQTEEIVGGKAFHKNYTPVEFKHFLADHILRECSNAEFSSPDGALTLKKNKHGEIALLRTKSRADGHSTQRRTHQPDGHHSRDGYETHDRRKKTLLPEDEPPPFLTDLGVMTAQGKIVSPMNRKFRQINKFLECIDDILPSIKKIIQRKGGMHIADFGCGKSYLTFAVYYFLKIQHGLPVRITGIDLKQDVIEYCNSLADRYGYTDLLFQCGDIASFSEENPVDMMVALHACDTATDAALAKAVLHGTEIILSVPCCQHEINSQLEDNMKTGNVHPAMRSVFAYGILRERAAAIFTDAMRAAILSENGYAVQVIEFVDMQHTAKNVMIRAVKQPRANSGGRAQPDNRHNSSYRVIKEFLAVAPCLEKLLEEGGGK